jgi:hypothetical protein
MGIAVAQCLVDDARMVQLAMPLFTNVGPVRSEHVLAAWSSLFAAGPRLEVKNASGDIDEFAIDGRVIVAAYMPVPVPIDEVLRALRSSWMWQGPEDAVREHRSHAIVTSAGEGDEVVQAWDVARLSAALLSAAEGASLYWGNSRQVHTTKIAVAFGASNKPPVPLWVGITVSARSAEGPLSAATHGLEALGHKEFEVLDTSMRVGDLRTTLLDFASYVLERGSVMKHGQTIGPTADVKWSIAHAKSKLVKGRDAIVLGIP